MLIENGLMDDQGEPDEGVLQRLRDLLGSPPVPSYKDLNTRELPLNILLNDINQMVDGLLKVAKSCGLF